ARSVASRGLPRAGDSCARFAGGEMGSRRAVGERAGVEGRQRGAALDGSSLPASRCVSSCSLCTAVVPEPRRTAVHRERGGGTRGEAGEGGGISLRPRGTRGAAPRARGRAAWWHFGRLGVGCYARVWRPMPRESVRKWRLCVFAWRIIGGRARRSGGIRGCSSRSARRSSGGCVVSGRAG